MFELKKPKGTDYVVDWKLKGLFESKLPLHGAFLPYKIFWIQNKNTIQQYSFVHRTKHLHEQNC